jgi:ACS family hexuronate transporter-like MFS transporter
VILAAIEEAVMAVVRPRPVPRAASSHLKIPRFRFAVLATNILVLILNYGDRAAIGVAAPLIIKEFGFNLSTMGFILSAFALSYAPACFLGGWSSDRFGPRKVMALAVAWWSLLTAATAGCFNLATFLIQRLCFGLGEGPQGSVTARTMSNWFPQREYATAVGLSFAANPLGAAIGTPIVAGLLVWSNNNWRVPFLVLGAVGLCIAALWYIVVRDHPEQHPLVTEHEQRYIAEGGFAEPTVERLPDDAAEEAVPGIGFYVRQTAVWGNALAFFGFSWILFMFLSWYPVFLVQQHHINLKSLAWAGSIPWIAGAVGTALGGYLSDVVARRTSAPFATRKWAAVICLAAGAILTVFVSGVSTTFDAVALLTVALLMLYLSNVQFFALVRDSVHPKRLGAITGFVHFCANLAAIIAPTVTGFVVQDLKSWELAFGLATGIALVGALALALARRPDLGTPQTWGRTAAGLGH